MGKIRKTYDAKFKKKAVDLYLKEGMGYKAVTKELGISHSMVRRWVKRYEQEGIQGLEEKRGKAKGPNKGRPRTRPEDPETKIKRLEAEVEMLKKLLKR
ncbi:MAG: helix-turn-helix domain-containing protein [Bacillaceae bacterium]|jgi:transposase|uniref:Transposase n=1 Tax=Aeribacillus pallidus TaxID=33936 RepID=A0A161WEG5_9BACI|nr:MULTISPECIES: helix-turn-helix domain-containing protein [Aeribacillus]REJ11755.1 MAG: helix-turn-helix domain-containing protein [Bacillaceae bacterium]ASS90594.1 transposase [Aeribacillus pallidus]KZM55846.1 transposase [Aeribacillus pallidus]MED0652482.1 helix-turn-helix domain-containing protein [Aeribacillus composti]MED4488507.1 helix-turn-helix domain-containing protein [Aeribacillus pallidus]